MVTKSTTNPQQVSNKPTTNRMPTTNPQQAVHQIERIQQVLELDYYPRESFREGLCNHRRWFVCLLPRG